MPAPMPGQQQNAPRGRRRQRMMVPRYSAGQAGNRPVPPPSQQALPQHAENETAANAVSASPPLSPPPKPPERTANPPERKLTDLLGSATDLPARIARLDGETLLLLGILWMLWQEKADRRLLLALAYILL